MELADVVDSKSTGGDTVPVRVRPPAPSRSKVRFAPTFFTQKKSYARSLAPPFSQKTSLVSAVRLQALSQRLHDAIALLRDVILLQSSLCSDFFKKQKRTDDKSVLFIIFLIQQQCFLTVLYRWFQNHLYRIWISRNYLPYQYTSDSHQ